MVALCWAFADHPVAIAGRPRLLFGDVRQQVAPSVTLVVCTSRQEMPHDPIISNEQRQTHRGKALASATVPLQQPYLPHRRLDSLLVFPTVSQSIPPVPALAVVTAMVQVERKVVEDVPLSTTEWQDRLAQTRLRDTTGPTAKQHPPLSQALPTPLRNSHRPHPTPRSW